MLMFLCFFDEKNGEKILSVTKKGVPLQCFSKATSGCSSVG